MKKLFLYLFLALPTMKCVAFDEDCVELYPRLFDKTAPYVTTISRGQLGNELFQAVAGISLALDNNARYIHRSRRYPEFFKQFFDPLPNPPVFSYQNVERGYDNTKNFYPIPFQENIELDGYFLSYKYFDHHREAICKFFTPSETMKSSILQKYGEIFNKNLVVGLHVRTFYPDKGHKTEQQLYQSLPAPNMDYIQTAIEFFSAEAVFIVCSDNIEWAKKALKPIKRKFFFSNASFIEDFYLLSACDHVIISHSTFSWWAAYLNGSENKTVIAPVPFRYDNIQKTEDIYPQEWVLINCSKNHKIPKFGSDQAFFP